MKGTESMASCGAGTLKHSEPCGHKILRALILASLILLALPVRNAFSWGAFFGVQGLKAADTHQLILNAAFDLLSWDPGMRHHKGNSFAGRRLIGIDEIQKYEGVYGNPLDLSAYGPGPDADGPTYYSYHWFNPLTGQGQAPQAAYDNYMTFIQGVMGKAANEEEAVRGIAWSAHFTADMFVPYHIVGISLNDAIARMNSRNYILGEREAGPPYFYSPVPTNSPATNAPFYQEAISQWWREGWGVNSNFQNAYQVFWENRMNAGGNTADFTIDGHWSNGQAGRLQFRR